MCINYGSDMCVLGSISSERQLYETDLLDELAVVWHAARTVALSLSSAEASHSGIFLSRTWQ